MTGYKNPPRHTQFQKGRSGNPSGRPRQSSNVYTLLRRVLMEPVIITEKSESRKVTKLEAILLRTANAAASRNLQAFNVIVQYQAAQRRPINEGPRPPATFEIIHEGPEDRERRIAMEKRRRGERS